MSDKKSQDANPVSKPDPSTSASQAGPSASITVTDNTSATKASQSTNKTAQAPKAAPAKSTTSKADTKQKPATKAPQASAQTYKQPMSKLAIFAVIIALIAIALSAGQYYLAQQQTTALQQQLKQTLLTQQQQSQQNIAQQLQAQQQELASAVQSLEQNIARTNNAQIEQLQQQLALLQQNNPSDWLLHESEYLIRVAGRSLWLEKDAKAAIALLHDAEQRVAELNDPQYLPLREAINQDIARLQLLPKQNSEQVILQLMALEQQLGSLTLAMVTIPDSQQQADDLTLTDNIVDWRENLAKSWRKFLADFITVSRRTGNVEPLMSPEYQQNLRENLSLKLQTAIWAASKDNMDIYRQSLTEAATWVNNYFDNNEPVNVNFAQALNNLTNELTLVDYPTSLESLAIARKLLSSKDTPSVAPTPETTPVTSTNTATPIEEA